MINNITLSKKYFDLGVKFYDESDFLEAEKYFRSALLYFPDRISILTNLSATLIKLNKCNEAQEIIDLIQIKDPNNSISHLNRGNIYLKLHDVLAAQKEFLITIDLDINYAEAYNNYAFTLQRQGFYDEALENYDKAINKKLDYTEAYYNKIQCLIILKKYYEALQLSKKALEIDWKYDDLYVTYVRINQQLCNWDNFDLSLTKIIKLIDSNSNISSIFCLLSIFDDPFLHLKVAKKYSSLEFPSDKTLGPISFQKNNKIKIAYFSADLHNHATAYLIAELFELHDKSNFEIHAFSFGPDIQDSMRSRIFKSIDYFHNVRHLSDIQIVQMARANKIDIAIDLKGYTFDSRPGIFSKRTAPIQVNYLGYPSTMGADYIDYIIADRTVIPENLKNFYSEKIIFLPNTYQVNDTKRSISSLIPSREDEKLPLNAFVFCCFNNVYKILPNIFAIWMDILKSVDNSVLWLLEDNYLSNNNLKIQAHNSGINPERIIFAKRKKIEFHLARIQLANLFLDTFPYNAHTTSSDALWAGLPVITCIGNTFASRVSASLLKAINVPELITYNFHDYKNLAIDLALYPEKIKIINDKINSNRLTMPLFNSELFTVYIEKAYKEIYSNYINNNSSSDIYIS